MKFAFIVKDPKTYVNAEEARYRFARSGGQLILFILFPKGDPNNVRETLEEVIDPDLWDKIILFKTLSNYRPPWVITFRRKNRLCKFLHTQVEYLMNLIDRVRLDRLALRYSPCDLVFSGHKNTQEHLAASLKPNQLYLMDSGMMILKKIRSNGYIDYSQSFYKSLYKKIMFRLIRMDVFDRSKTKFFTAYSESVETKHSVIKNNHSYKRKRIREKPIGSDTFLVSSPIYQMTPGVTLEGYISYLKAVMTQFDIQGDGMVYIPHPTREDEKSISRIRDALGCRVDSRLIPIEVKISTCETLPNLCISPCSSSIVNIAAISENRIRICSAWHREFSCFQFLVDWRNSVQLNPSLEIEFVDIPDAPTMFGMDPETCREAPLFQGYREWEKSRV